MSSFGEKCKAVLRELQTSVKQFPLEALLGLTYFIVFVVYDQNDKLRDFDAAHFFFWLFPHYVLLFTLHRFCKRHTAIMVAYIASWFLWIPLLLFCNGEPGWCVGMSYLISIAILVVGNRRMDNESFGANAVHTLGCILKGLLPGALLMLVYSLTIISISFLFGLDLNGKWFAYPNVFIMMVVTPLLCCVFVANEEEAKSQNKFLLALVERILSPALVIYTVILYVYGLKILLLWQLPKGGVAYMATLYVMATLAVYLLRYAVGSKMWEWFYGRFAMIALPPTLLLWVGSVRRISEYGLTEWRVYLIVCSVLTTLYVVMLMRNKTKDFQLMTILFALAGALFTYLPFMSAKKLSIVNQQSRLESMLPHVLQNDSFPEEYDYAALAKDSVKTQKIIIAKSAWDYLKQKMDTADFRSVYGKYGHFNFYEWKLDIASDEDDVVSSKNYEFNKQVNLGKYTVFVPNSVRHYQRDTLAVYFLDADDKDTIITCNVLERLQAASQDTTADHTMDVLTYQNEKYMVLINQVTGIYNQTRNPDSTTFVNFRFYGPQLFKKE